MNESIFLEKIDNQAEALELRNSASSRMIDSMYIVALFSKDQHTSTGFADAVFSFADALDNCVRQEMRWVAYMEDLSLWLNEHAREIKPNAPIIGECNETQH